MASSGDVGSRQIATRAGFGAVRKNPQQSLALRAESRRRLEASYSSSG